MGSPKSPYKEVGVSARARVQRKKKRCFGWGTFSATQKELKKIALHDGKRVCNGCRGGLVSRYQGVRICRECRGTGRVARPK